MVSYMVDIGSWLALGLCTFEGLGFCGEVVRRDDHRISLVDTVRCEGPKALRSLHWGESHMSGGS